MSVDVLRIWNLATTNSTDDVISSGDDSTGTYTGSLNTYYIVVIAVLSFISAVLIGVLISIYLQIRQKRAQTENAYREVPLMESPQKPRQTQQTQQRTQQLPRPANGAPSAARPAQARSAQGQRPPNNYN
jgi:hypothetical protein